VGIPSESDCTAFSSLHPFPKLYNYNSSLRRKIIIDFQ
jgi:hypothetical protein